MDEPDKLPELWGLCSGRRWLEPLEDAHGDPILAYFSEEQARQGLADLPIEERGDWHPRRFV